MEALMNMQAIAKGKRSGSTSALMLSAAVGVLALPSAVLAVSSGIADQPASPAVAEVVGGFIPSEVDPRLARSITVRALNKGRLIRFTPAATPSQFDSAVITVAVRLPGNSTGLAMRSGAPAVETVTNGIRIAPTAYSLGTARGYRSFAENMGASSTDIRKLEMPDLASYQPKGGACWMRARSRAAVRGLLSRMTRPSILAAPTGSVATSMSPLGCAISLSVTALSR
jgi:hypothetical protein